jgi:hypothetical protein
MFLFLALLAKHNRGFAKLVNDELQMELVVPASMVMLKTQTLHAISVLPHTDADRVQFAYSALKYNLMCLSSDRKARPTEDIDLMEFCPAFVEAFKFPPASGKRKQANQVAYDLEKGTTSDWDPILGVRWDLVVSETYIVKKMTFKRERYHKSQFNIVEKLHVHLDLVGGTYATYRDYRANALQHMLDRYRPHTDAMTPAPLTVTSSDATSSDATSSDATSSDAASSSTTSH